jgi:hypothetical protein
MSRNCSDVSNLPRPPARGVRRTLSPSAGRGGIAIALVLLAACAPHKSAAEKRAEEDRAIAQVNAAQSAKPPVTKIAPQPILFADIQKYDLFGAGCAFAPGGSMGAVLLTRAKSGTMKIADKMVRFASDPGSTKLPLDTVSRYVGKEMALSLTHTDSPGTRASDELIRWPGHLVVTDPFDRVVYEADGQVECGA